ncbi:hypothetical protein BS47DRAFT_1352171 [Hydnum rufescens UP504]|uniref:Uncharacterized protein n=1 Tax=Hydnum rufescens UP504 TaxID=1448309 RepID=A0A9P6AJP6_9AGAM|nr:hypothetical protein BS47DRAFT_1352171 [Hydnum rufescens UP504]
MALWLESESPYTPRNSKYINYFKIENYTPHAQDLPREACAPFGYSHVLLWPDVLRDYSEHAKTVTALAPDTVYALKRSGRTLADALFFYFSLLHVS